MGIKKIILLLITTSLLCASCSNEEEEPQISGYEGTLTIHARYADGKYDDGFDPLKYDVKTGNDISNIILPNKDGMMDGHPVIAKGIYTSKKEKTKVKASQLKNFDGTFSDLYVVYYYKAGVADEKYYIDFEKDFDGEYTNYKGLNLTICKGIMTSQFGDFQLSSSVIKRGTPDCYCDSGELKINSETLTIDNSKKRNQSMNYGNDGFYYEIDHEGNSSESRDLTISYVLVHLFFNLVSDYYQKSQSLLEFYFLGKNTLSIDYDLPSE